MTIILFPVCEWIFLRDVMPRDIRARWQLWKRVISNARVRNASFHNASLALLIIINFGVGRSPSCRLELQFFFSLVWVESVLPGLYCWYKRRRFSGTWGRTRVSRRLSRRQRMGEKGVGKCSPHTQRSYNNSCLSISSPQCPKNTDS